MSLYQITNERDVYFKCFLSKLLLHTCFSFSQMPGVTVKDVNQQEFVRALAAFLKK